MQYISHEARGPLNVASMGLELHLHDLWGVISDEGDKQLLTRDQRSTWVADQCSCVSEIADACMTAQSTLNDLLTYDKIESGMLDVEKTCLSVFPFIQKQVCFYAIQARYKRIEMQCNWGQDEVHPCYDMLNVLADKHKISQVFKNLLSNALKFTNQDGIINIRVKILCCVPSTRHIGISSVVNNAGVVTDRSEAVGSNVDDSSVIESEANSISTRTAMMKRLNGSMHKINTDGFGGFEFIDVTSVDFDSVHNATVNDLLCRVEIQDFGPGIAKVSVWYGG